MKFCPNCGTENEKDTRFCSECGHDFNGVVEEKRTKKTVTLNKPALTKTQKIIAGATLIVLLVAFGGFKMGEKAYSKENQVNHYIEVLASGDASKIAKVVVSHDPHFKITKESVTPYANYLTENKSYVSSLGGSLRQDSLWVSDEIYLEQNGKTMLFFDKYDLVLNPVYFNVSVNIADAAIHVNGEEVFVSNVDSFRTEVGPYAPGIFAVDAAAEINGYEFENKADITVLHNEGTEVYLPIEGVEFSVTSNQDTPDVYLGGEKIGTLTDSYGEFGPISWSEDLILELGIDFPSGVMKSEAITLDDFERDYYLYFANDFGDQTVVDQLFGPLTRKIVSMSEGDGEDLDEEDNEELAKYLTGGKDNELYTRFTEYAEVFRGNADAQDLDWSLQITDVTQTDVNLYNVKMDFKLTTRYTSASGRDNLDEAYEYEFVVESFENSESWEGIGFTLSEIVSKVDTLNE